MLIEEFLSDGMERERGFQLTNYNGNSLLVEGFRDLLFLGEENIILKLTKGELNIIGANLKVRELGKTSIFVVGKIFSVTQSG